MNIGIKLDITINGAQVFPNNDQFKAIKKAIQDIVFNGEQNLEIRKTSGGGLHYWTQTYTLD